MLNIQNTYTKSPLLECAPQDDDDDDGRKGEHTRPCLKTNLHARKWRCVAVGISTPESKEDPPVKQFGIS